MKSAIALIAGGSLLLALSLGGWALTRPALVAGDAVAFEQALNNQPATPADTAPASSTRQDEPPITPADPSSEDAGLVPRFTISQPSEGDSRMPVGISIPALDQEAPIIPAGVEANGDMTVPDNVSDVAWYKYGSAPGEPGSAVLAAHVDLAGQGPGVFFDLRSLQPGSVIYIEFDDGSREAFRAEARTIYDKNDLPTEAIFSRQGPPVLTLITCGGDFNRSVRRYDSNVVVYAVPVDEAPPATL